MAPIRKVKSKLEQPAIKQSKDRVIKRGLRGFHRFRSGELNVTPKGREIELVKANRESPLLRLPPELRRQIWELVLGGHVLSCNAISSSPRFSARTAPLTTSSKCVLDLLRTCRQIYSETTLIPYTHNTFHFPDVSNAHHRVWNLQAFQKRLITDIQFETNRITGLSHLDGPILRNEEFKLDYLPGLQRIRIVLRRGGFLRVARYRETCMRNVRDQLKRLLSGRDIAVTFEFLGMGA
ncbi:hypothetical protein CC86DRAFT_401910 [Ophiobolus disseminans]|uniref:DUF7730 domain-containing protein n=1 Tax=Ophiobolus disseminans TaxID=1469910 RepID=A0A6A7ADK1_9PLEO|nr:hypothetical protein CC86DRAFT_401910 [Ophiobolus disseminans]